MKRSVKIILATLGTTALLGSGALLKDAFSESHAGRNPCGSDMPAEWLARFCDNAPKTEPAMTPQVK